MAAECVRVSVAGAALALLLYENVKSRDVQEGFLLGDVSEVTTRTVTDADIHNINVDKLINVTAVIPCPQACLFYDNIGQLDRQALKDILGDQEKLVVAWFKYGRDSKFKLTMRDKIVHKQLSAHLGTHQDLFACCLLTSAASSLQSTRTYSHSFLRYHNRTFQSLPLHIDNLGENHDSYKPSAQSSKMFLKIYNSMGLDRDNVSDWDRVENIQDALHKEINKSVIQLGRSEQKLGQLEREVEQLRQNLDAKRKRQQEKERAKNILVEPDENLSSEYMLVSKKDEGLQLSWLCDVETQTDKNNRTPAEPRNEIVCDKDIVIDLTSEDSSLMSASSSKPRLRSYAKVASQRTGSS